MLGEALNGVIGPIFETTWNVLKHQYDAGLKDTDLRQKKIQLQQATQQAARAYHQKYLERHCNVKVLPGLMKEAMPLDTIYTAVKFLGASDLKYFSTLDDLEEMYRQSGKRRFRVGSDEKQDGLEAANQEQYLMVLGGPGVGKSTFLRKLGLEALKGNLAYELIPVFVELKSFKSQEQTIAQAIIEELEIAGFPGPEILLDSLLSEGKILVLLDGLDEVPTKQENDVIEQIRDFCDRYSQNRFVTSCRIAAYKGGFSRFTDVTIAEFDDEQIEQFIQRWFNAELDVRDETAQRFWSILKKNENEAAKELARTPLLLTFLCLVYDRSQSLPSVRSTLYGDALNILLKEWAAEKRLEQDPIYQGFHIDLEKELLSEIAYESFVDNQLFFSEDEIIKRITNFLKDTLDAPKYLDGFGVLKAIERQQGILVERATEAYSFSHLTLQEYLVAKHISSQWIIDELVKQYLTDKRWREIFLLVSGLVGRRSHDLWTVMQGHANIFLSRSKVKELMRWTTIQCNDDTLNLQLADRCRFLESLLTVAMPRFSSPIDHAREIIKASINVGNRLDSSIMARDIANAIATSRMNASASAITRTKRLRVAEKSVDRIVDAFSNAKQKAIDTDWKLLASKLTDLETKVPQADARAYEWQAFTEQLTQMYFDMFYVSEDLITLNQEDEQFLEKYLYSVKLILDCRSAAVRVSLQQWQAIEAKLLTAPTD